MDIGMLVKRFWAYRILGYWLKDFGLKGHFFWMEMSRWVLEVFEFIPIYIHYIINFVLF